MRLRMDRLPTASAEQNMRSRMRVAAAHARTMRKPPSVFEHPYNTMSPAPEGDRGSFRGLGRFPHAEAPQRRRHEISPMRSVFVATIALAGMTSLAALASRVPRRRPPLAKFSEEGSQEVVTHVAARPGSTDADSEGAATNIA